MKRKPIFTVGKSLDTLLGIRNELLPNNVDTLATLRLQLRGDSSGPVRKERHLRGPSLT
jgi:hypothetical protein